jgi:N-acetylmuramic acid 6-phosphate (MurNAc-6-P) etherase
MGLCNIDADDADALLQKHNGYIRAVIAETKQR